MAKDTGAGPGMARPHGNAAAQQQAQRCRLTGMADSGSVLPGRMGASAPEYSTSPSFTSCGKAAAMIVSDLAAGAAIQQLCGKPQCFEGASCEMHAYTLRQAPERLVKGRHWLPQQHMSSDRGSSNS